MNKHLAILTTVAVMATLFVPVGALAQELTLDWDSEVNPEQCSNGELVINITHKVTNDVDSAVGGGVWAGDNYSRHIQIWQVALSTFCAVVQYHGAFVTDDGPSPEGTDPDGIAAGIEGTFEGGYRTTLFTGTLNPSPIYSRRGNIGAFDYRCDVETDPGDHSTCTGLFSWPGTYFTTGTVSGLDFDWWGWIYNTESNGTWINACIGPDSDCPDNSGNITD